eukprot:7622095-Alexandrium_andersonii.AAC.1
MPLKVARLAIKEVDTVGVGAKRSSLRAMQRTVASASLVACIHQRVKGWCVHGSQVPSRCSSR